MAPGEIKDLFAQQIVLCCSFNEVGTTVPDLVIAAVVASSNQMDTVVDLMLTTIFPAPNGDVFRLPSNKLCKGSRGGLEKRYQRPVWLQFP